MSSPHVPQSTVCFGEFTAVLEERELFRNGSKVRLQGQPFEVLAVLLEHPGRLVTRDELRQRLWPSDTFVDFEHGLNAAVNRLREALGDSAENPRFVETLPRRGYRFVAPVDGVSTPAMNQIAETVKDEINGKRNIQWAVLTYSAGLTIVALLGTLAVRHYQHASPVTPRPRALSRITFDSGLQIGATWSPDGRLIAYSSNRGGKFDIWVQQVSGGEPVQVTHGPSQNWQPDWSPDGKYIAYRSEEGDGGIYVVPALGGSGLSRKVASLGYYPRWSPDGSQILFRTTQYLGLNRFYVVALDGSQPREILTQFHAQSGHTAMSATWYPDGKKVTFWIWSPTWSPNFWTVPLEGGTAIRSEFSPEVAKRVQEVALRGIVEWTHDYTFSWSPSGRYLYCELTFRGAMNVWRMTVDPRSLRITSIERLTVGPGPDGEIALSPDGRKLAFTAQNQHIWAWLFPFDASQGKLKGVGQAASPDAMQTWRFSLSPDGKKLAFSGNRSGRSELWVRSLLETQGAPVIPDDLLRDNPRWSPDRTRLAYLRSNLRTGEDQLIYWTADTPDEEIVSDAQHINDFTWSPDGQLLVSQTNPSTHRDEIWLLDVPGVPRSGTDRQRIIFDSAYDLYEPSFSPDGHWMLFKAVRDLPTKLESTLYVVPRSGAPWTKITNGRYWDDKPRWSPDGKIIYFVSGRSGFFNVWATRFDSSRGKIMGEPFVVTNFDTPAHRIPQHVPSVDLSITQDKLVVTVERVSGSLWLLDDVD